MNLSIPNSLSLALPQNHYYDLGCRLWGHLGPKGLERGKTMSMEIEMSPRFECEVDTGTLVGNVSAGLPGSRTMTTQGWRSGI